MDNKQEDAYTCPSFSSYSSDRLAEIAVRVAAGSSNDAVQNEDDEDFQFALVREDKEFLTEEFVRGGQIGTVYPVFGRDILLNNDDEEEELSGENKQLESSITVSLSKLFVEDLEDRDGDNLVSCSSSEADELENIPVGTYCVWRPKVADHQPSSSRCKKSNSTGSASKRWKFRDLLRSNSEGKDSSVFLTPKNREDKFPVQAPRKAKGKGVGGGGLRAPSAHEELYVQNRAIKEGNKKKSYLPYRRDLVGFFVDVNGLSKSFPRF